MAISTTNISTISGRNEVKLAVMAEKVGNIESDVKDIKTSITDLQHSMDDGYAKKIDVENVAVRVKVIEGQRDWAVKIVIGAIILSILGLVLVNKPF